MNNFGLHEPDAEKVSDMLIKHSFDVHNKKEGLPVPAIEKHQYPVPVKLRKSNGDEIEEDVTGPMGKTSAFYREPIEKHKFPPEKHKKRPGNWPYDDMTTAWMNRKSFHRKGYSK